MPLVLFNRRRHPFRLGVEKPREHAARVDSQSLAHILGFAHIDFEHAIDQKVVNLSDASLMLDPQVMDNRDVLRFLKVKIYFIGCVLLPFDASPDEPEFSLNVFPDLR